MTLPDFLTDEEIKRAHTAYCEQVNQRNSPHDAIVGVIEPLMPEIDRKLGQEGNDVHYLAYAIEYVFQRTGGQS